MPATQKACARSTTPAIRTMSKGRVSASSTRLWPRTERAIARGGNARERRVVRIASRAVARSVLVRSPVGRALTPFAGRGRWRRARHGEAAVLADHPPRNSSDRLAVSRAERRGRPPRAEARARAPRPGPRALGFKDGLAADPSTIGNFRGLVALAYMRGSVRDSSGRRWLMVNDMRLFQGDYVAADGIQRQGTFAFV